MSFDYLALVDDHRISSTKEIIIANNAVNEVHGIRMIHMHNSSDVTTVLVQLFLICAVSGTSGAYTAEKRFLYKELAPGAHETFEFPVPGLLLNYLDRIEGICDQDQNVSIIITGGRDY